MLKCPEVQTAKMAITRVFCKPIYETLTTPLLTLLTIRDLKCMTKVASAVLILREGNATEWTSELDAGFDAWLAEYIKWLTTAQLAVEESKATK